MSKKSTSPRIPVTVLGGYLGAGKTTIINRLLRQSGDADPVRIAVLVNDFGTINLDAALISSQSDSVIELSNGCICCSLADGFAATLDQIHQRTLADPSRAPQQLLIETSGVALPGTVAQYAHMPGFELASIIVVADGEQLTDQLSDRYIGETIRIQLGAADLILISKTDLIDAPAIKTAKDLIRSVSSGTAMTTPSDFDLFPLIFGPRAGATPASRNTSPTERAIETTTNLSISLTELRLVQPVERQLLEQWLQAAPPAIARAKGVVHSDEGLLRVDRVGPRVAIQTHHDQIDPDVVGSLVILSISSGHSGNSRHSGVSPEVAHWLNVSPAVV